MRSHLADGRVVEWFGRSGTVVDAELTDREPPRALAARYGREDFWARWTRAEALAKLAGVPIVLWLGEHGLDGAAPEGAEVRTVRLPGLTLSVAHWAR